MTRATRFLAVATVVAAAWVAAPCLAVTGTVTAWDYNGGKLETFSPVGLSDVVQVGTNTIGGGFALKKDGSVYQFSSYPGYEGPTLKSAGPWAGLTCSPGICWVRDSAGTWTSLSTSNITPVLPANLNSAISLGGGAYYGIAVNADGTATPWGTDLTKNGSKAFAAVQALTGVRSVVSTDFVSAFLMQNGTVKVISFTDSIFTVNLPSCNQDGTLLNIPAGVVATQIALGECLGAALRADGTVVTWGYKAPNLQPPAGIKKVRKVQADGNFTALLVDGTVVKWGANASGNMTTGPFITDPADLLQKTNVLDIAQGSGTTLLLHSTSCGGVPMRGCCQNDKLSTCSDTGSVVTTQCAAGTCGWSASAGLFSSGSYACGTTGGFTPVGAPYKSCTCEPYCVGKVCGSDGCGGTCGSCAANNTCDASGACKCTLNCDDGNVCTADGTCDASGCTHTAASGSCSTGKCSTGDSCVAKVCVAGAAVNCNDADACTTDSCSMTTGCAHAAVSCDDGNACTTDSCSKTAGCQHANNTSACSDGNACTQNDACSGGKCAAGAVLNCDDGNACSNDSCIPASGCSHSNNTVACSDGNACSQNDACSGGKCVSGPNLVCDDANPCTDDSCDPAKGCAIKAAVATCTDNNACTSGDVCSSGKCQPGNVITCDDGQVCTQDGCDPQKGCTFTSMAPTTPCDDGNVCTTGDHCQDGKCTAANGVSCDDNNPCTNDPCDGKGGCAHTNVPDGQGCDDGDLCTTTGKCGGGACGGLQGVNCDDGLPCTLDSCDKSSGCKHMDSTTLCDDGNPCTAGDTCKAGSCVAGAGCDDSAVCTLKGGVASCVCKGGYVGNGKSCSVCVADCNGKACGSDGCGGQCGICKGATVCDAKNHCQCAPQCDGRTCGPDGCGGSCGSCPTGEACNNLSGTCAKICVPSCAGKTCGADGCGGTCGSCGAGQFCMGDTGTCRWNVCPSTPPSGCCSGNTLLTCDKTGVKAADCNASSQYCGWNATSSGYGCTATPSGTDPSGKNPRECSAVPKCVPDCGGKTCGSDGCGGSCGTCGAGALCDFPSGNCLADPCLGIGAAGCCNGNDAVICDAASKKPVQTTCNAGNGACGWSGSAYACDHAGASDSSGATSATCPAKLCIPNCTGKACGDDGCGGTCGTCGKGQPCLGGACCMPDCTGKNCGSDGCGGSCGTCASSLVCNEGLGHCMGGDPCQGAPFAVGCCAGETVKICQTPYALQSEDCSKSSGYCGWDPKMGRYGCGTLGGSDPKGKLKLCKGAPACVPDCAGKSCGPNGCGGTCPSKCAVGESCTKDGTCAAGCGDLSLAGCCDGGKVYYCGQIASTGAWSILGMDCKAKGMDCGYSVLGSYACVPGKGSADPSGSLAMACPASVVTCKPDCIGKACGPDGCGGQCGQCDSFEKCEDWTGICYVPPADCQGNTWKGSCDGSKLSFCSVSSQVVTQDCGAPKEKYNGTKVPMCKWVDSTGAYGCNQFVDQPIMSGYSSCKPTYGVMCGKSASYWACQCDLDCEGRGDCCPDFAAECGQQLGVAVCGDGKCATGKGEGCATCAADCQTQCQAAPSGTAPPWSAPFAPVLAMAGKPSQRAEMPVALLDNPLPSEPPVPLGGLLAWLPARGAQVGGPQTHVTFGDLGSGGLVDAPGRQGPSLGLLSAAGAPSGGVVRIAVEKPLPRATEFSTGAMGGLSLAMWVKVPTAAPDVAQPLASTYGPSSEASEVCGWSRPSDAGATITCPSSLGVPSKVVGIYGYYGAVEKALLPQWDAYTQSTLAPHGRCAYMAGQTATHACEFSAIQPWLEAQCLGKSSCHLDPWPVAKDPCTQPKDPNVQSTLMVRALCAPDVPVSSAYLAIDNAAGGHRLRYEVPGLPPLLAISDLKSGTWHHVALVHRPFIGAAKAGVTTLYVDGKPEATSETLVPPTFDQLWLGAAVVAGTPKTAPNLVGTALAAIADLDDVFLYDRALSDHEVRSLLDKPDLHLARMWPPVSAEAAVAVPAWESGAAAEVRLVEAGQLLGPGATTTGQTTEKLHANHRAVHVPAGATFRAPVPTGDLSKLDHFSLAAWIRVPALPTADAPLLRLVEGGKSQVTIAGSAACGQRALQASIGSGAATQGQACEHGLGAGQWAFVSLVQNGKSLSLRIDGHEIGVGNGGAAILPGAVTVATLEFTGEIDVAWAGLFDAALPLDELQRWRGQGPAVWSDTAIYADGTTARLRDYADFHNNSDDAMVARLPSVWSQGGTVAALPAGKGPLALSTTGATGTAASITVPARGRFGVDGATGARPFSWSGHLRFALPAAGKSAVVPLIEHRAAGGANRPFAARLNCAAPSALAAGIVLQCHIEAVAAGAGAGAWSTANFTLNWPGATAQAGLEADLDVALAWNGTTPSFALGARTPNATAANVALAGQTLTVAAYAVTWSAAAATWPTGSAVFAMAAPQSDGPAQVTLSEFRLYARVLSALELVQLVRRNCADASCNAKTCTQVSDAALPTCGACDASHFEAGDQMGDFCLPRRPFYAVCSASEQCTSGLCQDGRCQATAATDDCKQACGALKRTCTGHQTKVGGANATIYGCSADCVVWYTPPQVDPSGGKCVWTPTVADHGACAVDEACVSGKCVTNDTPTYDGGTEGGKVCAYASTAACTKLHRSAVAFKTGTLTGKPVYTCSGCSQEIYAGQPLWQESFSLMTKAACNKGSAAAQWTPPNDNTHWELCFHHGQVTLECLGTLLLGKSSKFDSADIAKLRKYGVGPSLLDAVQTNHVSNYGQLQFCYCGDCPTYTFNANAFHQPAHNHPVCIGHQYPNGTTCPPPGVTVEPGQESEFCESGFCARDTHKCENGVSRVEDTQAADRQDNKESKQKSDYGPLTVTQTNRATLEVRKQKSTGSGDVASQAAPKRVYSLDTSVTHAASIFGSSSVELVKLALSLHGQMDDKKAQYIPHLFLFGVEQPKVASMVPPSGCVGSSWKDGEYTTGENCAVAMKTATMTPTLPTLKFCPPIFKGCEASKSLPKGFEAGPTCIKRSTFIGPVPVSVEASARMEVCFEMGLAIDGQTFEPGFKAGPTVDIGVEVKGGVGVSSLITVFAGVKGTLSLLKLGFPTTWALKVEQLFGSDSTMAEGLFKVVYSREISAELTILRLSLALFVEVGFGPFKAETEYPLFDSGGINLSTTLGGAVLQTFKMDLKSPLADQ